MEVRIMILAVATIAAVFFMIHLVLGRKYEYLVESLDGSEYFLKNIYVVGFSMNDMTLFRMRGAVKKNLEKHSKLLNDNQYAEYYANLAWAQFLALALLVIVLGGAISACFETQMALMGMLVIAIFIAALWNMCISNMKEIVEARREACVAEFPNVVSKLALLLNSGMILREGWIVIANGKEGEIYNLMKQSCLWMENGMSDTEAIYKFGVLSDSLEIKKFTSALIQALDKGNSELVDFLTMQTSELWAHKRQQALQKGEVASGKLIIPIALMFLGVIVIILSAAMQGMSF